MKKLLCIPLVMLLYTCSYAQVQWFQSGDEWTYDIYTSWIPELTGTCRLYVNQDVTITGQTWKRLIRTFPENGGGAGFFYVRQESDKVFVGQLSGSKTLIYDFSLGPGDTLIMGPWSWYTVLDTGSVFLAGQVRRTQTIEHIDWHYTPLVLVEGIGATIDPNNPTNKVTCSYLFLNQDFCHNSGDGMNAYFRCFGNPQGVYAPFEGCLVDTEEQETTTPVQVRPNPADERLMVQGACLALRLFDSQGRLVYESAPEPENVQVEIPTADLPNGVYVLVCRLENGQLFSKRVCVLH